MNYYREGERPKDLRVEKTIDAIHSVFKQMLFEMDMSSITVKELCERARVNKKTFYRYYPAIEYLLAEMQQSYATEYVKIIDGLSFPKDAGAITRAFMEYSIAQDELYEKITCVESHAGIREKMIEIVEAGAGITDPSTAPKNWTAGEWEAYIAFAERVPLMMYCAWIDGGKKMDPQDLTNRAVAVVEAGSTAFIAARHNL